MEANQACTLLKGAPVSGNIDEATAEKAAALKENGILPTLAVIRFGNREDDLSYERSLTKRADKLGIRIRSIVLPADTEEEKAINAIRKESADPAVHGILVFRPLPKQISEEKAAEALDPKKDVDGMTRPALGGLFTGKKIGFAPCTAQAVMEICRFYGIPLAGKRVAVVGRSLTVGKPLSMLMLEENAIVTVCHSHAADLKSLLREADIVAAAIGKPAFLTGDCFRAGQTVLDVGIHMTADGGMTGDVCFPEVSGIVSALTPVPGGVGSVTTAILMHNTVLAAEQQDR